MKHKTDLFIGSEALDLPKATGPAASWFYIKAQIANTHPGPSLPFSPVSATAYSGGYPTGYGRYDVNTQGPPATLYDEPRAYGATHVQHSGTGYIRYFYNFLLTLPYSGKPVVPSVELLRAKPGRLTKQQARPGYYSAVLADAGVTMELAAAPHAMAHRYTFESLGDHGVLVDITQSGLAPAKAMSRAERVSAATDSEGLHGIMVHHGVIWYYSVVSRPGGGPAALWKTGEELSDGWHGVDLMEGDAARLLDKNDCAAARAGGIWVCGKEQSLELFVGLSVASAGDARTSALSAADAGFSQIQADAEKAWEACFDQIEIKGGDIRTELLFNTAWYHSCLKPTKTERSNFLWQDGPEMWTGLATMWDQYKTQLPFLTTFFPDNALSLAKSLQATAESLGWYPNAMLFCTDLSGFENQSRNLAVVTLHDIFSHQECRGGADRDEWLGILNTMAAEVEREADTIRPGNAGQGYSHLLDVSYAAGCVAKLAERLGRSGISARMAGAAGRWIEAFDPETGMMREGDYYEGGNIHYSFRLLHDMAARIGLCGGFEGFRNRLDDFFGFASDPTPQIGNGITQDEGIALGRFDGLNNEVMLETPFAYHYIGEPDRTSEIIHAIQTYQFSESRGGIPGNDDSGGLSSWYVWNALGLYPVPGQDLYLISRPLFDNIEIRSCGLRIEVVRSQSGYTPPIYLESVELNGTALKRSFLTTGEVLSGGNFRLRLNSRSGLFVPTELPPSRNIWQTR